MIYLNQFTHSTVVISLASISDNFPSLNFIWKIKSSDTNKEYIFCNEDYSHFPYYYSYFTFSVIPGATYGLTAGVIPAVEIGEFTYEVYETENYGDLNTSNFIKLLNRGLMEISGTYSVIRKELNIDTERKILRRNE